MSDDDRPRPTPPGRAVPDEEIQAAVPRQAGGREVRVGIFVIVGILAAVAVLYTMTDPATLRGRYMLVTGHPDAGGIRRGDPVTMRGVNVGRISSFDMVGQVVNITMEIEGDWEIPDDSYTRLAGQGLLGGRTMEIVPGVSATVVGQMDTIPSSTVDPGIMGTAEVVADQASQVMTQLNRLLADPTVTALQGTAQQMHSLAAELRSIVAVERQQIALLTARLNRSAEGLEAMSGAAPDIRAAAARADTAMTRLAATGASLDRTALQLEEVLARVQRGEGTLGKLLTDDSLYTNLNRTLESITLLATDIRENPRRYIRIGIFGF
jgi:phospholipid/cholesterol/gamma-HCH transport system substrate-binding protein